MKVVYKYPLRFDGIQYLQIPKNHKILHCDAQKQVLNVVKEEIVCLWALVDEQDTEFEEIEIHVYGTGHRIPENKNLQYVDSVVLSDGSLVIHVFINDRKSENE